MRFIRVFAVMLAALFTSSQSSASAAVVGFIGTINSFNVVSGGPGVLGDTVPLTFEEYSLEFSDGSGVQNLIASNDDRFLMSNGFSYRIVGGTAEFTENGLNDSAEFNLQFSSAGVGGAADGFLTINFAGDLFTGPSEVSQANYDQFGQGFSTSTGFTILDTSNGIVQYSGTLFAVPEPGALMLFGLVAGGCCFRRRRA